VCCLSETKGERRGKREEQKGKSRKKKEFPYSYSNCQNNGAIAKKGQAWRRKKVGGMKNNLRCCRKEAKGGEIHTDDEEEEEEGGRTGGNLWERREKVERKIKKRGIA
jgi:hypothetical protein